MAKMKKAAKKTETPETNGKPVETKKAKKAPKEKKPKEDLVVFAFRLTAAERDLIHQAAGPAKASKFIRNLAVKASQGDVKAVSDIVADINS